MSVPDTPAPVSTDPADDTEAGLFAGRIPLGGRTLRQHTARGTVINGAFQVGIITLNLLKGLVVAALLTTSEYGVWGVLTISLLTLAWLKQVGVADRFIQQTEDDQRTAFQRAFTLELLFAGAFVLLCAAVLPVLAVVYGEPRIVLPGMVLALALGIGAFQAPFWVLYRRMEFVRYRTLGAIDPLVGLTVTVVLAALGHGYWSLVIGVLAGACAGAAVAVLTSPYPLAIRYEGGTARQYVSFSWPLILAGASSLVISQGSIIAAEAELGLTAVGAVTLAVTIAHYSDRVDDIVTATLYPAICAVRDRTDLLLESFVKSNRLGLIWAMPFGVGISLFAADLVHHVLGDKWEPAIVLLEVFGLTAAFGHIGFNWTAFYRARDDTRPIAIWSASAMLAFLAAALPLLFTGGLSGFAAGIAIMTGVSLAVKGYYLARLFSAATVFRLAGRAIAPSVPAAAAVLLWRALDGSGRGEGEALAQLVLYLAITGALTLVLERALLREVLDYLRGPPREPARRAGPPAATPSG